MRLKINISKEQKILCFICIINIFLRINFMIMINEIKLYFKQALNYFSI